MFWNIWDLKKLFDSYKKLQEELQNTIIRSKEEGVVIEISAEMKVKAVRIEDNMLLNPSYKEVLEDRILRAFQKWQQKAQEVAMEKTKEILWFDPNDLASALGWFNLPKLW